MSAPYMQLYVADYLGDTRHLTTEQHGAYLLLLMTMWRSDGVLSDDPAKLARIAGLTVARWNKISDDVLAFFTPCDGGLTQGASALHCEPRQRPAIPAVLKAFVRSRDADRCAYCGQTDTSFHFDHVVPFSRGGGTDASNLVLACAPCNLSKGAKTLEEWARA
jgi:hypothetical protein